MVQFESSIERNWERRGRPLCRHENHAKEYMLGMQTGDMLCRDCGETWPVGAPVPPPRGGDVAQE